MTLSQDEHAQRVANRFKQMVEEAGHSLQEEHYQQLALLIESALDAVTVEQLEAMARKLEAFTHAVRHDEHFFSED